MRPGPRLSSLLLACFLSLPLLIFPFDKSPAAEPEVETSASASNSGATLSDPVSTGAAVIGIPIKIPPGRKGIAPNLSLTYSSSRGNGWVGVGWDLGLGAIQRSTKRGTNYSANDYVAAMNGAVSELVSRTDWGSNCYGLKIEKDFSRYYFNSTTGGWEVTAKNGTKYFYGSASNSRQGSTAGTFKWHLDRVEDLNGNYMTVTYFQDQGEVYPERIDYTGKAGSASPSNYVLFIRDNSLRTDVSWMYPGNLHVKTAHRLKEIQTYANGSLAGKYVLDYAYSANSQRSLLTQVTQFGSDGSSLPATKFTWQNESHNWSSTNGELFDLSIADGYENANTYPMVVGDFNGDGKTDVGRVTSGGVQIYLSNGAGGWSAMPLLPHLGTNEGYTNANTHPLVLGDFNGDGKTDVGRVSGSGVQIYLSDGAGGWSAMPSLPHLGTNEGFTNAYVYPMAIGDFNGDGKTDVGRVSNGGVQVYLSNGSGGWTAMPWLPHLGISEGYANANTYPMAIGDFNGDGKTDLGRVSGSSVDVYLSNGAGGWTAMAGLPHLGINEGFTDAYTYPMVVGDFNGDGKADLGRIGSAGMDTYLSDGAGVWTGIPALPHLGTNEGYSNANAYPMVIGDFNGDGKTDVGRVSGSGVQVYLADGAGSWTASTVISRWGAAQFSDGNLYPMFFGDFNGDGKMDVGRICIGVEATHAAPSFSDFITQITNPAGGKTTISYKSSSDYENTLMPFILKTVSEISVNDDNGNIATTQYAYSGGLFDFAAREFRGFAYQKFTGLNGIVKETWYKQDELFQGLPYDEVVKDQAGNIYTGTHNTLDVKLYYNTTAIFPYITQKDDYIYDGAATPKNVKTVIDYDDYGNLTRKYSYGDVAVSGDEKDEVVEYTANTTAWLFLPSRTYLKDSSGSMKSQAWFRYYNNGNLWQKEDWLNGGTNPVVTYQYDSYGNPTAVTDPRSNTATTAYDSSSHTFPTATTSPAPFNFVSYATSDYKFGKPLTSTDINGNTTTYDYDGFGRPKVVTSPENNPSPAYAWKEVYYDGFGRTIKKRTGGPDGKVTAQKTVYNTAGQVAATSLPYFEGQESPAWTYYAYDPMGRVTEVTNPDGTTLSKSYMQGRTTIVDASGHRRVEERDVYGRLVKVGEYAAAGLYATTTYQYDVLGNLLFVKDAANNQTTMTYDTLSRKRTMHDPDMGNWSYSYDANGNLLSQTDAKLQTISFSYDALNRVQAKQYPSGTNVAYTYDEASSTNARGKLTTVTDASGSEKSFYDALGNILKTIKTVDGTSYTTETSYDALGRPVAVKYPDLETVSYSYDSGGNLSGVAGYATYTGFNALGQPSTVTYANGVDTIMQYYPLTNRLYSITTNSTAVGGLQNLAYTYDYSGNIVRIDDFMDANRSQSFQYDDLNRLIQAQSTAYGGTGILSYEYNAIGNMTYNSQMGVYSYNTNGVRPHAVTQAGANTYAYDANGNMINRGGITITYDYDNRPVSAGSASFVYDYSGQRVKKIGSTTVIYIGKHYECSGSVCKKYIFAGSQRIAMKQGSSILYYHSDHLGSASLVTDQSGNKAEEIYYYPYGGSRQDSGGVNVRYKYTGQELDDETGLYYYNARYYDPLLGRFISADTIVQAPFDPQTLNRYSYCRNNPIIYTDPSGNSFWEDLFNVLDPGTYLSRKATEYLIDKVPDYNVKSILQGMDSSFWGSVSPQMAAKEGGLTGALTWITGGNLSYSYESGFGVHLGGSYCGYYGCVFGGVDWNSRGYNSGFSAMIGYGYTSGENGQGAGVGIYASWSFSQDSGDIGVFAGYLGKGWSAGINYSLIAQRASGWANVSIGELVQYGINTSDSGRNMVVGYGGESVFGKENPQSMVGETRWYMKALNVALGLQPTSIFHDGWVVGKGLGGGNVEFWTSTVPSAFAGRAIGGPRRLHPYLSNSINF